ncbi:putative serine carboxypeptidase CPVL [Haemaphysalis longicornis]
MERRKIPSTTSILLLTLILMVYNAKGSEWRARCRGIQRGPFRELLFYPTNDSLDPRTVLSMQEKSRVCFPSPCDHLEAFSGFMRVGGNTTAFLFFLHIKAETDSSKKPLLLWLQGGFGKSSLFGQFLENGPLGIDEAGKLYYRNHTLIKRMNIIYLDQPVGAGYSFGKQPRTLEEAAVHNMRFLRGFLRLFPEYRKRDFYIAGESYGARSATALAHKVLTGSPYKLPLRLKGVMLGVGFLFPILDIVNSADYLYYSGIIDECGRKRFDQQFRVIKNYVKKKKYETAAVLLRETVFNLRRPDGKSLFQKLTGFEHHGSIKTPTRPKVALAYFRYANSTAFKRRIHVRSSRALDGTRSEVSMRIALGDLFVDVQKIFEFVLNKTRVLFYTAEFDDVFPAVNLDRCFKKLNWRDKKVFKYVHRTRWHKHDNVSLELLGYEKTAGTLMYTTVLFGGHFISFDRSEVVSDLYSHFLDFPQVTPRKRKDQDSGAIITKC